MSVRNYVGARYVPKFADPVEWQANTSYEAMVIVTYNNASYTSKVPVPPTVGNPAENSKYWALTGNYNAQVEQYRQETENYNAQVEEYIRTASDAQEHAEHAIDGICANDEGNNTNASKDYSKNEYLWWHGKLYRVIADIPEGDTLSTDNNVTEANIADGVNLNGIYINFMNNNLNDKFDNLSKANDNLNDKFDNFSKTLLTSLDKKIKYKVYTTVRQADIANDIISFGIWFYPTGQHVEPAPIGATLIPIHAQYHYFKTSDEFNDSNNPGETLTNCTIDIGPRETNDDREAYHIYVSRKDAWSQAGYYFTIGVLEIM